MYLPELTTSAAIPSVVGSFAVRKRRPARLIAIDAMADASSRLKRKLKLKKRRKRDKNSVLRSLM
jgi:predicted GIY-YIG superfamily endonuclease